MAKNDLIDSAAALDIRGMVELFETSERNLRRWSAEHHLYRRADGLFPLSTSASWWLGYQRRRLCSQCRPDEDILVLTTKFLSSLGIHKFNEGMLNVAEHVLMTPVYQKTFEDFQRQWEKEIKGRRP